MARTSPTLPPVEHEAQLRGEAQAEPADAVAHDGAEARRPGWGSQLAAVGILMVIAGVALLGFPFLLDFVSGAAAANMFVCGGIAAFVGALTLIGIRHPALALVALAVGLWLFASSFFIGDLAREAWSERTLGAVVFFLGLFAIARPTPDPTRGAASSDLR